VLFKNGAARQFKGLSAGISGVHGTADCAERLVFKANYALGMRFFEPGGREFESLRARMNRVLAAVSRAPRCTILAPWSAHAIQLVDNTDLSGIIPP